MRLAPLALALALASPAAADCVWIPICLPPTDPLPDAMRVYHSGVLAHEFRPMWGFSRAEWSRTNFFQCGAPGARIEVTIVRGAEETARSEMRVSRAGVQDPPCPDPDAELGNYSLGSYYGPIEQLLRAVNRNQSRDPRPIDTDQDGTIRPNDGDLLRRTARREFADSTTRICVEDVCP